MRIDDNEWIRIKSDWDAFPSFEYNPKREGYFAGREAESNQLAHWIVDSTGGSVLVSGIRGVGKTAFVYYSIRQQYKYARKWRHLRNLVVNVRSLGKLWERLANLFVLLADSFLELVLRFCLPPRITVVNINASTINPERLLLFTSSENKALHREYYKGKGRIDLFWQFAILQQLISSLRFSKVRSRSVRVKLEKLYRWSISTGEASLRETIEKEASFSIVLNDLLDVFQFLLVGSVFAFILDSVNRFFGPVVPVPEWVNTLSGTLSLFSALSSSFLSYQITQKKISNTQIVINSSNFDYLYSELNSILSDTTGEIFVFVIDELDKRNGGDRSESLLIEDFVSNYKNLITLSSAKFIFISSDNYALSRNKAINISGEEKIDESESKPKNDSQPPNYAEHVTYFNWELFLPTATAQDILKYFDLILDDEEFSRNLLEHLAYYLYFECGGSYSSLKNRMREFIHYKEIKEPIFRIFSKCVVSPYLLVDDFAKGQLRDKLARLGKIVELTIKQSPIEPINRQIYAHIRQKFFLSLLKELGSVEVSPRELSLDEDHHMKLYGDLSKDDQELMKSEAYNLLRNINNLAVMETSKAGIVETKVNGLKWTRDDGTFKPSHFDYAQVSPGFAGLYDFLNQYTENEKLLIEKVDMILEWIENYKKVFELDIPSDLEAYIKLVFDDNFSWNGIYAFVSDLKTVIPDKDSGEVRSRYFDQSQVYNYLSLISHINEEWLNLRLLKLIQGYFVETLGGFKSSISDNDIYLLSHGKRRIAFVSKKADLNGTKVVDILNDYSGLKSTADWLNLKSFVLNYFKLKEKSVIALKSFQANSLLEGKPDHWREAIYSLDVPNVQFNKLNTIELSISSSSDYWRVGLAMSNLNIELRPLDGGQFTLWHLSKNEGDLALKYRRVPNKLAKSYLEAKGVISSVEANHQINLKFRREIFDHVSVLVNDKVVDYFGVLEQDFNSLNIIVWGDGRETAINFSDVKISGVVEIKDKVTDLQAKVTREKIPMKTSSKKSKKTAK